MHWSLAKLTDMPAISCSLSERKPNIRKHSSCYLTICRSSLTRLHYLAETGRCAWRSIRDSPQYSVAATSLQGTKGGLDGWDCNRAFCHKRPGRLEHYRTSPSRQLRSRMSAFGGKADIAQTCGNVR